VIVIISDGQRSKISHVPFLVCSIWQHITGIDIPFTKSTESILCSRQFSAQYSHRSWSQWWGAGVVICLERGADLHVAQLMPLPLTVLLQ